MMDSVSVSFITNIIQPLIILRQTTNLAGKFLGIYMERVNFRPKI